MPNLHAVISMKVENLLQVFVAIKLLYVQEVLTQLYNNLLYKIGQDFTDRQYVYYNHGTLIDKQLYEFHSETSSCAMLSNLMASELI